MHAFESVGREAKKHVLFVRKVCPLMDYGQHSIDGIKNINCLQCISVFSSIILLYIQVE